MHLVIFEFFFSFLLYLLTGFLDTYLQKKSNKLDKFLAFNFEFIIMNYRINIYIYMNNLKLI